VPVLSVAPSWLRRTASDSGETSLRLDIRQRLNLDVRHSPVDGSSCELLLLGARGIWRY
jgi:hypothetical protein